MTAKLRAEQSPNVVADMQERDQKEVTELEGNGNNRPLAPGESTERQSGSAEWRIARGEATK
jgi:hypothetical protein